MIDVEIERRSLNPFPKLMIDNTGYNIIILATSYSDDGNIVGIVLDSGLDKFHLVGFNYNWIPATFDDFHGTLTIKNK